MDLMQREAEEVGLFLAHVSGIAESCQRAARGVGEGPSLASLCDLIYEAFNDLPHHVDATDFADEFDHALCSLREACRHLTALAQTPNEVEFVASLADIEPAVVVHLLKDASLDADHLWGVWAALDDIGITEMFRESDRRRDQYVYELARRMSRDQGYRRRWMPDGFSELLEAWQSMPELEAATALTLARDWPLDGEDPLGFLEVAGAVVAR